MTSLLEILRTCAWIVLAMVLAGFFVAGGKPGGTNNTDRAGGLARIARSGMMDTPEEGLRFTDIRVTPTQVELGFAWNEALVQGLGPLEVFARDDGRPELVTRRDYAFNGSPVYWYETSYDVLGRPTGANDSRTFVREWLYNRRSELASAQVGANAYGYTYDTIGNRISVTENSSTRAYTSNELNQYTSIASVTRIGDRCLTPVASSVEPDYDAAP